MVRFYLTSNGEEGLIKYEYKGHDGSYASVLLMPFWNKMTYMLPRTVAPNLLTGISFLFTTFAFLLFAFFHPKVVFEGNSFFYFPLCCITSFFFFINQTLDAVDGKQARRTGNATGLGELWDHGLDSITVSYVAFIVCCLFECGTSLEAMFIHICFSIVTPMPTLEEYVTGVLRLGSKYNDTTCLLLVYESILILAGIFGTSLLGYRIEFLSEYFGTEVKVSTLFVVWFISLTIFNVFEGFRLIFKEIRERKEEMKERRISYFSIMMGYFPVLFYVVLYLTWCVVDNEFYREHTMLFCCSFSLTVSYTCARIVFCRATGQTLQWTYLLMVTTLITFIACNFSTPIYKNEIIFGGLVGLNGLIVLHFWYFASTEMAETLGIEIFKVRKDMKISDV